MSIPLFSGRSRPPALIFRSLLGLSLCLGPLALAGCAAVPYALSAAQVAATNKASAYLDGSEPTPAKAAETTAEAEAEENAPYRLVADKQYEAALPLLRDRADRGDARAQEQLGLLYLDGLGVPVDPARAFEWMHKAADTGRPAAQHTLARFYAQGTGCAQDETQAVLWAQRSMAGGDADGTVLLATLHRQGRGVPQDYGRALELYHQADLAGSRSAPAHIASMYKNGQGVPREYRQAIEWYGKAAERGHADGWLQLAALYATCPDAQHVDGRRAISYALKATEKKPQHYAGWAVLAAAYARSGDFTQAMEAATRSDGLLAADTRLDAATRQAALAKSQACMAAYKENQPISEEFLAIPVD